MADIIKAYTEHKDTFRRHADYIVNVTSWVPPQEVAQILTTWASPYIFDSKLGWVRQREFIH